MVERTQLTSVVCSALDRVRFGAVGTKTSPIVLVSPGRWPQAAKEEKKPRAPVVRRKTTGSNSLLYSQKNIIVFNGHHTRSKGKSIESTNYNTLNELLSATALVVTPPLSNANLQLYTTKGVIVESLSELQHGSQYVVLTRGFAFTRLAIPSVVLKGRRMYPKELDPRYVEEKHNLYEVRGIAPVSPDRCNIEIPPNERKQPEINKQPEATSMTWVEHAKNVLSDVVDDSNSKDCESEQAAKTISSRSKPTVSDIIVVNGLLWSVQIVESQSWHIRQVLWQKDLPETVPANWRNLSIKPVVFLTDNCKIIQPLRSIEVLATQPPCVFWVDVNTGIVESASLHTREGSCAKCFKVQKTSSRPQPSPPQKKTKTHISITNLCEVYCTSQR